MLRKKVIIICASISMIAFIAVYRSADSEAVTTCRADLESSLKSPSSLKIIDTYSYTDETEVSAARTEYILPKLLREEKLTDTKTRVVPIQKVMITCTVEVVTPDRAVIFENLGNQCRWTNFI